eukprot:snap_masked-scaffold_77-processed-gene-0.38-mRNA-1 protein AED:0.12 eAED:0.12 QI:0/-1/0/1/-1/1/1/0/1936
METKGRRASNIQYIGEECKVRQILKKCFRCEESLCDGTENDGCLQMQGISNTALAVNIPSVSDTPWAVNGSHRNDFGNKHTTHVCVMLSSGDCIKPPVTDELNSFDYRNCSVSCWGYQTQSNAKYFPVDDHSEEKFSISSESTVYWEKRVKSNESKEEFHFRNAKKGHSGSLTRVAGQPGVKGYNDGASEFAKFNSPQDVAVDHVGNIYVADTENHCIRMIKSDSKVVLTVAGVCEVSGFREGIGTEALFNSPKGLSLYYKELQVRTSNLVILVSDSGNHRIRSIALEKGIFTVGTFAGQKGQEPKSGYRDGTSVDALFYFPIGIVFDRFSSSLLVADSYNHLIRKITFLGDVFTVAGKIEKLNSSNTYCIFPCREGVRGYKDGRLMASAFSFPRYLATNSTGHIFVTEENRIRVVDLEHDFVSTFTGSESHATTGGTKDEVKLHRPSGLVVSPHSDKVLYVADTGNCLIRRLRYSESIARTVNCETTFLALLDPKGCSSGIDLTDGVKLKLSATFGNIYYNYKSRSLPLKHLGWKLDYNNHSMDGRLERPCVGVPPSDTGIEFKQSSSTLSGPTDTGLLSISENYELGTTFFVLCPKKCVADSLDLFNLSQAQLFEESLICASKELLAPSYGATFKVTLSGESEHTLLVTTDGLDSSKRHSTRSFILEDIHTSESIIGDAVSGKPVANLDVNEACGYKPFFNTTLPKYGVFHHPVGLAIDKFNLSNKAIYLADRDNHIIRRFDTLCGLPCENSGVCIGDDICLCAPGWEGVRCTRPICNITCIGARSLCVAPNTCACIAGYQSYPDCRQPLCVQSCGDLGSCTAPDTCSCPSGWVGPNCTTPACPMTCGNGGNCTRPSQCTCLDGWTGFDCRTPVCPLGCSNMGRCIAPGTCQCSDDWTGVKCDVPVCHQGFLSEEIYDYAPMYLPCNLSEFCKSTNLFNCYQETLRYGDSTLLRFPFKELVTNVNSSFSTYMRQKLNGTCIRLEFNSSYRGWFSREHLNLSQSPYMLNSLIAPLGGLEFGDRHIALAQKRLVPQARYSCGNGGMCYSPGLCNCTAGWVGFDCRTPVCTQGYFMPSNEGLVHVENVSFDFEDPVSLASMSLPELYEHQGLYQCSVRAYTQWENDRYVHEHPNYFSRYMDSSQFSWRVPSAFKDEYDEIYYFSNMGWPPVHFHTEAEGNYTNKGWQRVGTWKTFKALGNRSRWQKGRCETLYQRTCKGEILNESAFFRGYTNDTEVSHAPSWSSDDFKFTSFLVWKQEYGTCIDEVFRGCYNNSTCVAPNTCRCADGWTGFDCSIPVCNESCSRKEEEVAATTTDAKKFFSRGTGNCTFPNTCTCEKGWRGKTCDIPICAQECNNNGKCVAPDTCSCWRWPSEIRNNRNLGGWPMFRNSLGDSQLTGWTGYDCSTPVCVQAIEFVINIASVGATRLGGYGLILEGHEPVNNLYTVVPRRPYRSYTFTEDIPPEKVYMPELRIYNKNIWQEYGDSMLENRYRVCRKLGFRYCSLYPDADPYQTLWGFGDGEVVRNDGRSYQSGCKPWSARFADYDDRNLNSRKPAVLCEVDFWEEGDYFEGRNIRVNDELTSFFTLHEHSSMIEHFSWIKKQPSIGEGIYKCANMGSCVSPDECSCPDGYTGFDCAKPLCRHLHSDGVVRSCVNNGICVQKDVCSCVQFLAPSYKNAPFLASALTGYNGTDCSIAICTQGSYDPDCEGINTGKEGCFRCKNGGNCTGPNKCTCAEGWTGFDCGTPACTLRLDSRTTRELNSYDPILLAEYELNPCGENRFSKEGFGGRGNCTAPNTCTCWCSRRARLKENGEYDELPWTDPLGRELPIGFVHGTGSCIVGYEGIIDPETNMFRSCHLQIYEPTWFERYAKTLLIVTGIILFCAVWGYIEAQRAKKQEVLLQKAAQKRRIDDSKVKQRRRRQRGDKQQKERHNRRHAL